MNAPALRAQTQRYELVKRTDKGAEYIRAMMGGEYRYLAIGGAVGGVKSFTTLSALICLCKFFPGSRWAVVRKDLPTLKRNTIPSIEKMRPTNFMAELNRSDWIYRCANGSELLLFSESLDVDPDLNRWKGLEVNGFLLEEANELSEKTNWKAIERAGRWVIPATPENPAPKQPPPLILYTFNPADNWVKSTFWDPWNAGQLEAPYFFLPTAITDNPFLPQDYLDSIKNLPEAEYRRFVLADWNVTTHPRQLIHSQWLEAAAKVPAIAGPTTLGVDVARYGSDMTVAYRVEGNSLVVPAALEYGGQDTAETADRVAMLIQGFDLATGQRTLPPINADQVRVDVVGLGGGTVDALRKKNLRVRQLVAGGTPFMRASGDPNKSMFRYKNIRSQMWWEFREKVRTGRFRLPFPLPKRLFADLTSPQYEIVGDKVIEVESKDDLMKRLGRSTDHGDALVMAAFDMPRVTHTTTVGASRSYVSPR